MTEPISNAPATPTPAAPVTPDKQGVGITPPNTPAKETITPVESTAPAKTLVEQAGEPTVVPFEKVEGELNKAIDAWKENPSEENKALVDKALVDIKAWKPTNPSPIKAPDKYEMKAEGVSIDQALLGDVSPILKEAGITNDQLNKLTPVATKIQEKAIAAYVASKVKEDSDREFAEQTASKEALGAKWEEQLGLVAKARDRFFSPQSKEILSKYGNNIHLINDLIKLGKSISEGRLVDGKPAGGPKSAPEVLYPSMNKT